MHRIKIPALNLLITNNNYNIKTGSKYSLHSKWDGNAVTIYKGFFTRLTMILCLLTLFACSPLQTRLKQNLNTVDYSDGVSKEEASVIAEYYRLNNLKWVDLVGPSDAGTYWSFKLTNGSGKGNEALESPPVLILKNAWSLKSAVRFDQSAY